MPQSKEWGGHRMEPADELLFCTAPDQLFSMPANHNALLRYKLIDQLLMSASGATKETIVSVVKEALAEYGRSYADSTFKKDLRFLRGDPFYANIICEAPHYRYRYQDRTQGIFTVLKQEELRQMKELLKLLRQWQGAEQHELIHSLSLRLADVLELQTHEGQGKVHWELNQHFESNRFLGKLFTELVEGYDLAVDYETYEAEKIVEKVKPHILKEYNRRWYLVCSRLEDRQLRIYALDRLRSFTRMGSQTDIDLDLDEYFEDQIGLTRREGEAVQEVRLFFKPRRLPYVLTKPLHASQRHLKDQADGANVSLQLRFNPELLQTLLSFGSDVRVISPPALRQELREEWRKALEEE